MRGAALATLTATAQSIEQLALWRIATGIGASGVVPRAGQAMGLNVFTLFVGFGLGSLAFGALLQFGFEAAFGLFTVVELAIAILAFVLFRSEVPSQTVRSGSGPRILY